MIKLKREKLSQDAIVTTLSFVSFIALIMQGWFVDYDRLAKLVAELPISQGKLKGLEIQSKLQLATFQFKNVMLYRLHHSIPHRLPDVEPETRHPVSVQPEQENHDEEDISRRENVHRIENEDEISGGIERRMPTCTPVNLTRKVWTPQEPEILHEVACMRSSKTIEELYKLFKEKCMSKRIAFRTLWAFKKKIGRL